MRSIIIFSCFLLSLNSFGQKRIGVDLNTHLINLNCAIHFQEVIKGPFLYSAGIFFGGNGYGSNYNSNKAVENGHDIGAAYPGIPSTYTDTSGTYNLKSYSNLGRGFGVQVGLGVFKEFGRSHGIRFNINNRFGWMKSDMLVYYHMDGVERSKVTRPDIYHPVGAVSLELYHTIRISGRSTFCWGLKAPYFYTLDKGRFNPQRDSELYHKFKLDLSIGITRAIGSCD
jgi:hypothetical protein